MSGITLNILHVLIHVVLSTTYEADSLIISIL